MGRHEIPYRQLRFTHLRLHIALTYIVASLAASMTVAGCGASHPRGPVFRSYPVKYLPNGVRILARERLPDGSYLAIAALRYVFMGHVYTQIGFRPESPNESQRGRTRWSTGLSLEPEPGKPQPIMELHISSGCVGSHATTTLAEGLLNDPRDTVTAEGRHGSTAFKRVAIPASLYTNGAFVYALLAPGPVDVVTRTPTGQIVSRESHPGLDACHNQ